MPSSTAHLRTHVECRSTRADDRRHGARGTLLGVWAHPDDETYLSGGLMLRARRAGCRVVVLTMTAGELGTQRPTQWPPARLGALRRHELSAALAALNVTEHRVVGFPDGGCDRYDATELIGSVIDEVEPTTIVTFGPDGFTGHPDHRAVSRWCTRAWHASGRRGRLWYAAVAPEFHREHGHLNAEVDLWSMQTGAAPCAAPETLVHEVRLQGAELDQKIAALRAHASQTTEMIATVGEDAYWSWWSTEWFRAAPSELESPDDAAHEVSVPITRLPDLVPS